MLCWGVLCVFLISVGCKKTSLPEERDGAPVVVFSGILNGENFNYSAGVDSIVGETDIVEKNQERCWKFTMRDHKMRMFQTVDLWFRNHQVPFQGAQGDLTSTIRKDSFNYAFVLPPINSDPFQTGRVEVNYTDAEGKLYESIHSLQAGGYFNVISANPIVRDEKSYLLTEVSFSCLLVNTDSQDTISLKTTQANLLFGGVNQ